LRDAIPACFRYLEYMVNVFLADSQSDTRSALRLMIEGLKMNVVGEANSWDSLLALVPASRPDLLLVDWNLINPNTGATLAQLRNICPDYTAIVLVSAMDASEQAARSAGVDAFISKNENIHHVTDRLIKAATLQNAPL
jgi:DNA-binding NarL/FixJ family response regulator